MPGPFAFAITVFPTAYTGDLDHDGSASASDLAAVLNAWRTPGAELNGHADTNAADLVVVLSVGGGACGG